jgi:hypothetical protein
MSDTPTPDYYKLLQVDPLAEEEVIEAAYRRLARKYHPDVYHGPDAAERMRELNLAYGVVGNPAGRLAYDLARQREAARQELLASQTPGPLPRTTGRQRAVTVDDLASRPVSRTSGRQRAITPDDLARRAAGDAAKERDQGWQEMSQPFQPPPPSVRVSTGNWPAITPTTGKIPVASSYVYRPSFFKRVLEELLNLGQGLLAIVLFYPIAAALCWFTLQGVWQRLGLDQHQAFLTTLALPVLPALVFAWWFGRRIRLNRP